MLKKQIKYIFILLIFSISLIGLTKAYYTSQETLGVNVISSGTWIPKVIINEVMWSGTSLSINDQWIELFNTTDEDIDIGKWKIENVRHNGNTDLMIPASRVIPANGYFLISNYPIQSVNTLLNVNIGMSNASITLLEENNGNLILKDRDGNIIDKALGDWPEGILGDTFNSMQRKTDSIDGLNPDSWFTCTVDECKSFDYWKPDSTVNYGTPNAENK